MSENSEFPKWTNEAAWEIIDTVNSLDITTAKLEDVTGIISGIIAKHARTVRTSEDAIKQGIAEAVMACHCNAVEKQWWAPGPSFPEALMLVVSELSEALEDFRNKLPITDVCYKLDEYGPDGKPMANAKPEGIPIEMADAVIRIFDLCGGFKIPLAEAVAFPLRQM